MEQKLQLADDIGFRYDFRPRPIVKFKKLHEKAVIPKYQTEGAAGMDLTAVIIDSHTGKEDFVQLAPGQRYLVSTGLAVELPNNSVGYIHSRSGLAVKQGVAVVNGVGVADADYRGEIKIGLINLSNEHIRIKHGDRIAQLVVVPVIKCEVQEATELSDTTRGAGGFGSTKGF